MHEIYGWINTSDALNNKHALDVPRVLDVLFSNNMFIDCICHGKSCANEGDGCFYTHDESGSLGPKSEVSIQALYRYDTRLSLEELYYYLNIAYQNYIEDGQYPETIKLFADGLEYFRNACDIKGTVHKETN